MMNRIAVSMISLLCCLTPAFGQDNNLNLNRNSQFAPTAKSESLADLQRRYQQKELAASEYAKTYHHSDNADAIKTGLQERVKELFELQLQIQSQQIDEAEKRLRMARERLDRRKKSASQIVQKQVASLLDEKELSDSPDGLRKPSEFSDFDGAQPAGAKPESRDYERDAMNFSKVLGLKFASEPVPVKSGKKQLMGLRVASVVPGGLIAAQGIKTGDIVYGIERWSVRSLRDVASFNRHLLAGKFSNPVKIYIARGEQTLFSKLTLPDVASATEKTLALLQEALQQTKADLDASEKELLELQKTSKSSPTKSTLERIRALSQTQLDKNLVPLLVERNKYAHQFGAKHPTVVQLDAELNVMKKEWARLMEEQAKHISEVLHDTRSVPSGSKTTESDLQKMLKELGLKKSMLQRINKSVDKSKYEPEEYKRQLQDRTAAIIHDDPLLKDKSLESALRIIDQRIEYVEAEMVLAAESRAIDEFHQGEQQKASLKIEQLKRKIERQESVYNTLLKKIDETKGLIGQP